MIAEEYGKWNSAVEEMNLPGLNAADLRENELIRMVRPTSVVDVQVLLGDPKLAKLLIWEQQDDRVVAKPKHRLSHTAFQEILRKFRQMGGGYSGYVGFTVKLKKKR